MRTRDSPAIGCGWPAGDVLLVGDGSLVVGSRPAFMDVFNFFKGGG
jgi:hypothetical protein